MDIKTALKAVTEKRDLNMDEMLAVMTEIMTGQATPAQIGGFLIGLRMKGETVEEITAAAQVMRQLAIPVNINAPHLVDIVGTGGDGLSTFNISTTSAFVVAAAGAHVAKHGNRSVSSRSGSADILEALGVKLDLTPEQIADCVQTVGVGFMFAPQHHTAMKHAIAPRREMAVRTIFNLLGPLTNPAKAPNQLLGVFSRDWLIPVAEVLKRLGSEHVLVVHSEDGLDEISIAAQTFIAELREGSISTYTIQPETFGICSAPLSSIQVNSVAESLTMVNQVLNNQTCPARDVVLLNAGATLYAAGITDNIAQGIVKAREALASGAAKQKLTELVSRSQGFARIV
ncbi:anthranilate phosphoribosyltransferase [Beggiatoa leptomitoformis]|uniref:Anthranilate phosphoribosyltransferase n=1 Tax=Beggiatoa leptomitoformis TaxID=288004 RepID=A0A2N9YIF2_9GAMM|nr:anthranilate phosphoribosyltransferase [Beggiatoa leptomitoformis]ALG67752.1 anthranilate phosphoribosyltransferase [Beggiatoa leptomitoformis]AUI70006.1 anthranilate phosphoribosyltransferase [Beggiatoa leptomitoformis]